MHTSQVILAAVALFISSASAGCFSGGNTWPNKQDAYDKSVPCLLCS